MKKMIFTRTFAAIGIAATFNLSAQTHGHLNVGATGTSQGDPLRFDNGVDFESASGYVKTLVLTNGGTYAGYYHGNITLTALAATADYGGPIPGAPALGSHIQAQLVSVDGPPGGAFGFWESGSASPTFSLPSGWRGTNSWRVSQTDGLPGDDPFGHIHGRQFTATRPGLYTVGFRAVDVSTNGVGEGPIHSPSDVLYVRFQAGITITRILWTNHMATIEFGAEAGQAFTLEYTTTPGVPGSWEEAAGPLAGNDYLMELIDAGATDEVRFYRVNGVPVN